MDSIKCVCCQEEAYWQERLGLYVCEECGWEAPKNLPLVVVEEPQEEAQEEDDNES